MGEFALQAGQIAPRQFFQAEVEFGGAGGLGAEGADVGQFRKRPAEDHLGEKG